jgi:tetratricopeptide (TPR) repeat protein
MFSRRYDQTCFFALLICVAQCLPVQAQTLSTFFPTQHLPGNTILLQQAPDSSKLATAQTLYQQGVGLLQSKQYGKAVEALQQAVTLLPDFVDAQIQLGVALLKVGQPLQSLSAMKQAVKLAPADAKAYIGLGNANDALQRYAEAIEAYKTASKLNPKLFSAYHNLGNDYLKTGRVQAAADAYGQALQLEPDNLSSRAGLGSAYIRLGRTEEGLTQLREVVRRNPNNPNIQIDLARAYNHLGRYEEAVGSFSEVIRLVPRFPTAYFERCLANLYTGQSEAAASDAAKFLELTNWHNERAQYMVIIAALGYERAGRDSEKTKVLSTAVERAQTSLWPYPIIQYLRGEISAPDLLARATDNDKQTEVHAYLGMHLSTSGQATEALHHLQWVKENGNRQFVEYPLALSEIRRLEK